MAPTGQLSVANCMSDEKSANEHAFLRRLEFSLVALLATSAGSKETDPSPYYKISYTALKFPYFKDSSIPSATPFKLDDFLERNGINLHFPPFSIDTAKYQLFMTATPREPYKNIQTVETSCFFVVKPTPPVIVLKGGQYRQVPEDSKIVLDAKESINLDSPQDRKNIQTMTFMWTCAQRTSSPSICSKPVNRSVVTIPEKHVVKGEVFTVSLVVRTVQGASDNVTQEIEVMPDVAALEIRCMKNCPPATDASNIQQITFLGVVCTSNCARIEERHYEWEIKPGVGVTNFTFDYERDTEFGRTGIKFIISEDVLQANGEYLVSVRLSDGAPRSGKTTIALRYSEMPRIEKCEVQPPQGESLKTWFRLNCVETPPISRNNFYELFVDERMIETVVSGFSPDVFRIEFLLPASEGRQFKVRVSKDGGAAVLLNVNPRVSLASENKTTQEVLKLYERFMNGSGISISKLINSKDPTTKEKGINMFQALVDEVVALDPSHELYKFSRDVSYSITQDLLKAPPTESSHLVAMSDSITKLVDHHQLTRSDPELAKLVSAVCKVMIKTHSDEIKRDKFPLNAEAEFNIVGRIFLLNAFVNSVLTACMEVSVQENFDVIRPNRYNITIAELPPAADGENILENYLDYVDFGKDFGKNMENLNAITNNVLEASALAAKSLALTTAPGEHFAKSSGNYSSILVAKDDGRHLAQTKIQLLDVVLVPSHDFDNNDHQFDILMFRWSKDLMWWNRQNTRVATGTFNIQFWHSGCRKRIRRFKSPVVMLIEMKSGNGSAENAINGHVDVPRGFDKMSGDDLNPHIRIHRIDLPARSVLHVEFNRTSYLDEFDVVLTKFEFPTVQNFAANHTISTKDSDYMRIINYETYDLWGYLGVLPSKKYPLKTKSPGMHYAVDFKLTMCVRWDSEERAWSPDCKPGLASTLKVLNCECTHFSAIAGYSQPASSQLQEFEKIDIVLELQCNYVIFITLAVTLGLFCLLLIPTAFRQTPPVYFVADNSKDHLYAYLVIVRTENSRNAGTTSNVVLQFTGPKGSSGPHVLNYPDPEMRLLQRQAEDMFIVVTEGHLGPIQKLEMWYDCIGASPSWSCRDIVLYDLQLDQQWYFRIKTIFSVIKGITHLVTTPTDTVEEKSIMGTCRICNHFHTWQLWAGEKNFSYTARLTVVFSNILMIYTLFMITEGLPSFELRDVFDVFHEFSFHYVPVSKALMCAVVAFVVHIAIAWTFRFTNIEFSVFNKTFTRTCNATAYCWILLSVLIGMSTSCLLVYGFWVPLNSSLVWLISCFIATVFTVVVLENAFIVVHTLFCKFKLVVKIDTRVKLYLKMIETQRKELYRMFDVSLLRPFLSHVYQPLQALDITKKRIIGNLRRAIFNDLEDLFMYGLYNVILYAIILTNKADLTTECKEEVLSMVEGSHTRTLQFSEILNVHEIYDYVNQTLIPTMQPLFWYGNYSIDSAGLMIDNSNKYVGIARLRQHRIRQNICEVPRIMKFLNVTCTPEFVWHYAEHGTYGPRWTKFQPSHEYDRLKSIWDYQTQADTETLFTFGEISTYSGGGYVAFLGRQLKNSYINLVRMLEDFWLDHKTRSLLVEFLVYNANYNVFAAVQLIFEQSATGYVSRIIRVDVVRMLFVENEVETAAAIVFYIFLIWVFMLMLKLSVDIVKNIRTFYKQTWLMIDLVINAMSILNICIYVSRMRRIEQYLDAIEEVKHNEFVSYFDLLYVEEFITYCGGILVLVATIRLWKFLRFGHFFRVMERTLSMAAFPLLAVTMAFGVICTAFGFSGILIFGYEHPELSFFLQIVATLIQLSLKPDQFDLAVFVTFDLAYAYFTIYLILMQVVLLVYITVIIMAYVKAQLELSGEPDRYTVRDYIAERMVYIPRLIRTKFKRLRGGEEEEEEDKSPVTSKADEFRYANCVGVTTRSMKSMKFICSCVIRNMNESELAQAELTPYERELMLGVCRSFVFKTGEQDDLELFFKGHFVGEKVHLVDEKRITKTAELVQLLFKEEHIEPPPPPRVDPEVKRCNKMVGQKIAKLKRCKLKMDLVFAKLNQADGLMDLVCRKGK